MRLCGCGHLNVEHADFRKCKPPRPADVVLTDPRYNIGHDYGPSVCDNTSKNGYIGEMTDFIRWADANTEPDAHLFVIHYPRFFFEHGEKVMCETQWEYRQQIRWCYASNIGQSNRKWTTASREILWLSKGSPYFDPKGDPEPYRNPNDKRVRALIEAGSPGRAPYDWWPIELQKNVGRDYAGYSNQIPRPLLRRIILCASTLGGLVVDPFAGTGSALSVAEELGREAWGCDLNPGAPCFKSNRGENQP